jgi:hypothetical protein
MYASRRIQRKNRKITSIDMTIQVGANGNLSNQGKTPHSLKEEEKAFTAFLR